MVWTGVVDNKIIGPVKVLEDVNIILPPIARF